LEFFSVYSCLPLLFVERDYPIRSKLLLEVPLHCRASEDNYILRKTPNELGRTKNKESRKARGR
jgi:hypothetical protein